MFNVKINFNLQLYDSILLNHFQNLSNLKIILNGFIVHLQDVINFWFHNLLIHKLF